MCEDSDQEISDFDIQSRTWKKLENDMKIVGFREGAAEGKNLSLQEGFNLGYADGFKLGELIGMCKGIIRCESELELPTDKRSSFDKKTLDNISNEGCVLCSKEKISKASLSINIPPENLDDLISSQQSYNNEIINSLRKTDVNSFLEQT